MFAAHNAFLTAGPPKAVTYSAAAIANGSSVTVGIPTHAVGDLIVMCAYSAIPGTTDITKPSASGTVPAWVDTSGTSTYKMRVAYFVATATNTTSGTWALPGGGFLAAVVVKGQGSSPIGGNSTYVTGTNQTAIDAPSVTMSKTDGSSLILHFAAVFTNAASTTLSSAPAGYTTKLDYGYGGSLPADPVFRIAVKDSSTSDGSVTIGTSAVTPQRWCAATVEIKT